MIIKKNKRKLGIKKTNIKKHTNNKTKRIVKKRNITKKSKKKIYKSKPKKSRNIKKEGYKSIRKKPTPKKKKIKRKKIIRGGNPGTELGENDFPLEWGDTVLEKAFMGREDVVKVILPQRIKKIGIRAFQNCSNLEEVVITPFLEIIGDHAFFNCEKLRTMKWLGYVKVKEYAFGKCPKFRNTVIDEKHFPKKWGRIIPEFAFYGRHDIKKVVIPNRINHIDAGAFSNCKYLESVYFNGNEYTTSNELIGALRNKKILIIKNPFTESLPDLPIERI
jgi:hypothetical protein